MSWRSLLGLREPKTEPELIAESSHQWQFRKISIYPTYYSWCVDVGDRSACLSWRNRIDGYWCVVDLYVGSAAVYGTDGNGIKEETFSQALWIAERFLASRGKLEKRKSGCLGPVGGPLEERFFWVFDPEAGLRS